MFLRIREHTNGHHTQMYVLSSALSTPWEEPHPAPPPLLLVGEICVICLSDLECPGQPHMGLFLWGLWPSHGVSTVPVQCVNPLSFPPFSPPSSSPILSGPCSLPDVLVLTHRGYLRIFFIARGVLDISPNSKYVQEKPVQGNPNSDSSFVPVAAVYKQVFQQISPQLGEMETSPDSRLCGHLGTQPWEWIRPCSEPPSPEICLQRDSNTMAHSREDVGICSLNCLQGEGCSFLLIVLCAFIGLTFKLSE